MLATATRLDNLLCSMLEMCSGLYIPREEEGRGTECLLDVPQPRPALGPNKRFLVYLKAMGSKPYCYPRGQANSQDKQVDRRARGLPAKYRGKLWALDGLYYNTV